MEKHLPLNMRVCLIASEAACESLLSVLQKITAQNLLDVFSSTEMYFQNTQTQTSNTIFLLAFAEAHECQRNILALQAKGISLRQLILAMPAGDQTQKIFAQDLSLKAISYPIAAAQMQFDILQTWMTLCENLLNLEIEQACCLASLPLLSNLVGCPTEQVIERARLAYALASDHFADLAFIQRTVRLAIYADLTKVPKWREVATKSRHLWCIKDLLENSENLKEVWPVQTPAEVALVACCCLALSQQSLGEAEFRRICKESTQELPFKLRTALRLSADRCFKFIWGGSREAA